MRRFQQLVLTTALAALLALVAAPAQSSNRSATIDWPSILAGGNVLEGPRIRKQDLEGKVLVINLWATWCGPCRKEIPALNELVRRFQDKNVEFLAITDEGPGAVYRLETQRGLKLRYRQYTEGRYLSSRFHAYLREAGKRANPRSVPQHTVIAPDGRVVLHKVGYSNRLPSLLAKKIEEALDTDARAARR